MNRQAYFHFTLLFTISFIGFSIQSRGQIQEKRLDSLFSSLNDFHFIHGNVLVAEKSVPVYKHSFGYRNIEKQLKNDDSTAFELASLSKAFTAVAIMQQRHTIREKLFSDWAGLYWKTVPWEGLFFTRDINRERPAFY